MCNYSLSRGFSFRVCNCSVVVASELPSFRFWKVGVNYAFDADAIICQFDHVVERGV